MAYFLSLLPPYKSVLQPFPLLILSLGITMLWAWRRPSDQRRALRWPTLVYVYCARLSADGWLADGRIAGAVVSPRRTSSPEMSPRSLSSAAGSSPRWRTVSRHGRTCTHCNARYVPLNCISKVRDAPSLSAAERHTLQSRGIASPWPWLMHCDKPAFTPMISSLKMFQRNTIENAAESAKWLKAHGIDENVLLVTTATHLPRSVPMFQQHGIDVIPAGCEYNLDEMPATLEMFLPKTSAVLANHQAWYEFWGLLRYRIFGR